MRSTLVLLASSGGNETVSLQENTNPYSIDAANEQANKSVTHTTATTACFVEYHYDISARIIPF